MSAQLRAVTWNRNKWLYDFAVLAAIAVYVQVFLTVAPGFQELPRTNTTSGAIYRAQAFGTCAFLLLTLLLSIGPLARLSPRFLPALYNRRHLGVLTCATAFVHVTYVASIYFTNSPLTGGDRWLALLVANTSFAQLLGFPFEVFGLGALLLLTLLAATSHDFWLGFLTPRTWKRLHMTVYAAYALLVAHIFFGHVQSAGQPIFASVAGASAVWLLALHLLAARREHARERAAQTRAAAETPWLFAGLVSQVAEGRAIVVGVPGAGERVAIFRHHGRLSALSNVCAHQGGPLGEGRVRDGCATCPWHGFQYRLEDGCAPAPFTEKLATYRLKLDGARILLDPRACAPGTRVEPLAVTASPPPTTTAAPVTGSA